MEVKRTKGRVAHAVVYGSRLRLYAKPSLGKDVLRTSGVRRTSVKVLRRNEAVAKVKPAKLAHDELVAEGKCPTRRVYEVGKGYVEKPVCPIDLMIPRLRAKMAAISV